MNVKTLIIRFGIGTLVAFSAAISAEEEAVIDLAAAEIVGTASDAVSADITARHGQFTPVNTPQSRSDAARTRSELKVASEMARELDDQLERRLAKQLDSVI